LFEQVLFGGDVGLVPRLVEVPGMQPHAADPERVVAILTGAGDKPVE
jgi:hypothetical protein